MPPSVDVWFVVVSNDTDGMGPCSAFRMYSAVNLRKKFYVTNSGLFFDIINDSKKYNMSNVGIEQSLFADSVIGGFASNGYSLFYRYKPSGDKGTLSEALEDMAAKGAYCIYKIAEPTETVIGTIPMPETFYDTTHIWEANGADISASVKVIP